MPAILPETSNPRVLIRADGDHGDYLNPIVWGDGNVHVLGDRGLRMELDDMKRFDSGTVLLTYLPAS